jgi:hypothetical protein
MFEMLVFSAAGIVLLVGLSLVLLVRAEDAYRRDFVVPREETIRWLAQRAREDDRRRR